MTLVAVEAEPVDAAMLSHLRHDLANLVAPLPIITELADPATAEVLDGVIANYTHRLVELDVLIDCPMPTAIRIDELVGDGPHSPAARLLRVAVPLIEWQTVLGALPTVDAAVRNGQLELVLSCPSPWVQAALSAAPGRPYCVKRVGTSLAAAAVVVARSGGRLTIDTDRAYALVALPTLES